MMDAPLKRAVALTVLVGAVALAACSAEAPPGDRTDAGSTSGARGSAAAAPTMTPAATETAFLDPSTVDACALLDEATVQDLTGVSHEFLADTMGSDGTCFWAVPIAGEPQYVEISVFRSDPDNYTISPQGTCSDPAPVAGAGTEAIGYSCEGEGEQHKVRLIAWGRTTTVGLLVNEPNRSLVPEDLAPTVQAVLDELE